MNIEQTITALGEDVEPVRTVLCCIRDNPELDHKQIALKLDITHDECLRLILRALEFGLLDRTWVRGNDSSARKP